MSISRRLACHLLRRIDFWLSLLKGDLVGWQRVPGLQQWMGNSVGRYVLILLGYRPRQCRRIGRRGMRRIAKAKLWSEERQQLRRMAEQDQAKAGEMPPSKMPRRILDSI